jgi:hypothetical protein
LNGIKPLKVVNFGVTCLMVLNPINNFKFKQNE